MGRILISFLVVAVGMGYGQNRMADCPFSNHRDRPNGYPEKASLLSRIDIGGEIPPSIGERLADKKAGDFVSSFWDAADNDHSKVYVREFGLYDEKGQTYGRKYFTEEVKTYSRISEIDGKSYVTTEVTENDYDNDGRKDDAVVWGWNQKNSSWEVKDVYYGKEAEHKYISGDEPMLSEITKGAVSSAAATQYRRGFEPNTAVNLSGDEPQNPTGQANGQVSAQPSIPSIQRDIMGNPLSQKAIANGRMDQIINGGSRRPIEGRQRQFTNEESDAHRAARAASKKR